MLDTNVFHALGLHMHQPPGNLELLIDANPWEAEQIIRCYERPTRYARKYADVGFLHIGFSGILLEQLRDPRIIDRYRHIIDIPAMLAAYRDTPNIELIGMGHFHPIFPLIPPVDWDEQLKLGRDIMADTFGRAPRGFWPPEMAFSMEMIPALVRAGYEYVVVDGVHVQPADGIHDVFRPYRACHDGACITVVPRDRVVSNAQESGLDAVWFAHEVTHRCRFSPRPHEHRLVTTWSDGENGGWFRQTHEGSGFFGHYFSPYMEHVRGGEYPIRPVSLSAYLADHPPAAEAHVQTGAWNVGSTSGFDFSQWAGSPAQRRAGEAVNALSQRWWTLSARAAEAEPGTRAALAASRREVLLAQTSCYLFWGDEWLPKLDALVKAAHAGLDRIEAALRRGEAMTAAPAAPTRSAATAPYPRAPLPEAEAVGVFPNTAPSEGAETGARLARSPARTTPPTPAAAEVAVPPDAIASAKSGQAVAAVPVAEASTADLRTAPAQAPGLGARPSEPAGAGQEEPPAATKPKAAPATADQAPAPVARASEPAASPPEAGPEEPPAAPKPKAAPATADQAPAPVAHASEPAASPPGAGAQQPPVAIKPEAAPAAADQAPGSAPGSAAETVLAEELGVSEPVKAPAAAGPSPALDDGRAGRPGQRR